MDVEKALDALGHPRRRQLLRLTLENPRCVRALAGSLGISEAAVSQHLRRMMEAGLLTREKKGYFTHYGADRKALLALAEELETMAQAMGEKEDLTGRECRCRRNCPGYGEAVR